MTFRSSRGRERPGPEFAGRGVARGEKNINQTAQSAARPEGPRGASSAAPGAASSKKGHAAEKPRAAQGAATSYRLCLHRRSYQSLTARNASGCSSNSQKLPTAKGQPRASQALPGTYRDCRSGAQTCFCQLWRQSNTKTLKSTLKLTG